MNGGCGNVCYDRVDGEVCLSQSGGSQPILDRLACTGAQIWSSEVVTDATCCYLMGQCGVGRPITVGGSSRVAMLLRGSVWG